MCDANSTLHGHRRGLSVFPRVNARVIRRSAGCAETRADMTAGDPAGREGVFRLSFEFAALSYLRISAHQTADVVFGNCPPSLCLFPVVRSSGSLQARTPYDFATFVSADSFFFSLSLSFLHFSRDPYFPVSIHASKGSVLSASIIAATADNPRVATPCESFRTESARQQRTAPSLRNCDRRIDL